MKKVFQLTFLFTAVVCLSVILFTENAQAQNNWKQLYRDFIIEKADEINKIELGYVNNDNTPELIYSVKDELGSQYASPVTPVYIATVVKGGLKSFVVDSNRAYGELNFYKKSGIIWTGDYQQGVAWTQYYRFNKNWKLKKILYTSSDDTNNKYMINNKYVSRKKHDKKVKNTEKKYKKLYGKYMTLPKEDHKDFYLWKLMDVSDSIDTQYDEAAKSAFMAFLNNREYENDSIFNMYSMSGEKEQVKYCMADIDSNGISELILTCKNYYYVFVYDIEKQSIINTGIAHLYDLTYYKTGVYRENGLGTDAGAEKSYAYYTIAGGKAVQVASKSVEYDGKVYYRLGSVTVSEKQFKKAEAQMTLGGEQKIEYTVVQ